MSLPATLLEAISGAYDLPLRGSAQKVSERAWRLSTAQGDMAIKLFVTTDDAYGQQEGELLAYLGSHGDPRFRVQTLLPTASGASTHAVDGMRVLVTRWEAGDYRRYDRFTPEEWAALGTSLAALHRCLDNRDATPVETLLSRLARIDADAERALLASEGRPQSAGTTVDAVQLRCYLDTCLRLFDTCYPTAMGRFPADDPQRPIHNDYNQFNYLFGAALPPVILDWGSSIGAPREFEVVRCLNHLPLQSPDLARTFLAAYLRVRPLRADVMAWAVDTSCLMHATKHWVLQGWMDHRPGFAERLHSAIHMVSLFSSQRLALAGFFTRHVESPG